MSTTPTIESTESKAGSSGFRVGNPHPTTIVLASTAEISVEQPDEASCPKCCKLCANNDAVGGAQLALHRVP